MLLFRRNKRSDKRIGPNPLNALSLIEKLALYHTIFNPLDTSFVAAGNMHEASHNTLSSLTPDEYISKFENVLIRSEDRYQVWLLLALVPWAKVPSTNPKTVKGRPLSAAATVARNGLKAPNKAPNSIVNLVSDASYHIYEIQGMIAEATGNGSLFNSSNGVMGQKQDLNALRLRYGKAIRRWGAHWRLCVVYAFFCQIFESDSAGEYRK